jgi:adenine-specific DNA-methyltransferase
VKTTENILPINGELPSSFAERLGLLYSSQVAVTHKKKNGQFFTPLEIARFMASLARCSKPLVRILDPGCGTAVLSCSLAEVLLRSNSQCSQIEVVAYETDSKLVPLAERSLRYLEKWLGDQGVKFSFDLLVTDFILSNSATLENQSRKAQCFDLIISNPPYFKLSKNDSRVKATAAVVHGQPNIYSIFLYIAATLLSENGQLIFITPRSFASGFYFRLFRDKFFSLVQLDAAHLFDSRKEAFSRDEVLQENVIISARRVTGNGERPRIVVSASHGQKDLDSRQVREFYLDELLDLKSYQKILHLPASDEEARVARLFRSWSGSLGAYNIQISTGPVVSFRATRFIHSEPRSKTSLAPLYWLHNSTKMTLVWPHHKPGKGQYIQICDQSLPLLIPNKNYVFLRRFSSKDDSSRLIATPYFADTVETDLIGVENHLNYIYRPSGHLDRNEILGLATLLNSALFDTYFRTFNGNINVSATELREMPLPPLEIIKQVGNAVILKNNFTQSVVDEIVNQFFELQSEPILHI